MYEVWGLNDFYGIFYSIMGTESVLLFYADNLSFIGLITKQNIFFLTKPVKIVLIWKIFKW